MENTKRNEISIRVSGENGDGIFSVGELMAKICSRMGLQVHGSRTYQSIIRGGHVSYSVRASNHPVRAPADYIDLLIALRPDCFVVDAVPMVASGGVVLYDSVGMKINNPQIPDGVKLVDVPAVELAKSVDKGLKILMNTVFVGVVLYIYNMHRDSIYELLEEQFGSKGEEVVNINKKAIDTGYNWGKEHCTQIDNDVNFSSKEKLVYIGGNEILSYGMLNGGLQSYAWYPMTPATPVGAFLAQYGPAVGCVVKQMEDEINVSNYAVGAGFAGARSACGTSGGGFALMTESIGFASIIEAPVVYIEVARGGPSTGLPTKTEQGDLNQLLGASQGDFPRAIISQVSIEDGFYLGQEALNIAEKFQMPVLISSDLYMGEHFETPPPLDYDRIPITRGKLILDEVSESELPYRRYKVTEDGISPRTIPGVANGMYIAGSDEHDEEGILISDRRAGFPEMIEERKRQMHKRMKKLDLLLKELPAPKVEGHNSSEAKILFVGWGSTLDTIRESRQQLEKSGVKTAQLHIKYVMPFHAKEVSEALNEYASKGVKILMVEGNYTGQMARHIRAETGFEIKDKYLRFDGEYILPREITAFVKETYKF